MLPLATRIIARLTSQRSLAGPYSEVSREPPWGASARPSWGSTVEEPLAIHHGATDSFGVLGLGIGEHTLADVIDLRKSGDYRMTALGKSFADFSATWAGKDPGAWADFSNDYMSLLARWTTAKVASQSPALALPFADTSSAYNGLLKALKQGAPPDGVGAGGPIRKGDYDDLFQRLTKAGAHVDTSQMPQPTAPDLGLALNKVLAPIDYVAMAKGEEASKGPLAQEMDMLHKLLVFWREHEHEIVLAGMVLSGIAVLGITAALIKAVKVGGPLALKVATTKYPLLAAAAA